ncbi:hypothetical protein THAOC_30913, partial [Thalassiosira oceanica]
LGRIYLEEKEKREMLKICVNGGLSEERAMAAISGPGTLDQKELFIQSSNERTLRGAIEQNRRVTVHPFTSVDYFGRMMNQNAARSIEGMHDFVDAMARGFEQAEQFASSIQQQVDQEIQDEQEQIAEA